MSLKTLSNIWRVLGVLYGLHGEHDVQSALGSTHHTHMTSIMSCGSGFANCGVHPEYLKEVFEKYCSCTKT